MALALTLHCLTAGLLQTITFLFNMKPAATSRPYVTTKVLNNLHPSKHNHMADVKVLGDILQTLQETWERYSLQVFGAKAA